VRQHAADGLAANKVRRLTIEDLATVEGTTEATRSEWQDQELFREMFRTVFGGEFANTGTGERWSATAFAEIMLKWFRVQWRLTPIRDAGLNPDDYSTLPTNEDGTPLRTPTLRMVDNVLRKA
jgi:hypothetical protein